MQSHRSEPFPTAPLRPSEAPEVASVQALGLSDVLRVELQPCQLAGLIEEVDERRGPLRETFERARDRWEALSRNNGPCCRASHRTQRPSSQAPPTRCECLRRFDRRSQFSARLSRSRLSARRSPSRKSLRRPLATRPMSSASYCGPGPVRFRRQRDGKSCANSRARLRLGSRLTSTAKRWSGTASIRTGIPSPSLREH